MAGRRSEPQQDMWDRFRQQRLKSWQADLPPGRALACYIGAGALLLCASAALLLDSWSAAECVHDYTEALPQAPGPRPRGREPVGSFDIRIDRDMRPPIWVYYELDGFHQNHRKYVRSREDLQLREPSVPRTTARDLPNCDPDIVSAEDGRVLYPCGLAARSVFNDSFVLVDKGSGKIISVDSRAETIAWGIDRKRFRNLDPQRRSTPESGLANNLALDMWIVDRFPPEACEQIEISAQSPYRPARVARRTEKLPDGRDVEVADCRWSADGAPTCKFVTVDGPFDCSGTHARVAKGDDWGVQSGHFLVWMRLSTQPRFRKLWGRVDTPLARGSELTIYFTDNFPVHNFNGRKSFVISTSSALGGRNDFLGLGYMAAGAGFLVAGVALALRQGWRGWRPTADRSRLVQR